mgnify:CR=1 FL=1
MMWSDPRAGRRAQPGMADTPWLIATGLLAAVIVIGGVWGGVGMATAGAPVGTSLFEVMGMQWRGTLPVSMWQIVATVATGLQLVMGVFSLILPVPFAVAVALGAVVAPGRRRARHLPHQQRRHGRRQGVVVGDQVLGGQAGQDGDAQHLETRALHPAQGRAGGSQAQRRPGARAGPAGRGSGGGRPSRGSAAWRRAGAPASRPTGSAARSSTRRRAS